MDNVIVVEDDSVAKKLQKTAEKLKKKYSTKKRVVNEEKLLKERPWWQKLISGVVNALLVLLILLSASLSVSVVISKLNRTVPSYAGYSALTIVSGSMVEAGFNIGDTIMTKTVDAHTLNKGDKIAFYVYSKDYNRFYSMKSKLVTDKEDTKTIIPFTSFFGVKPSKITEASKAGANLVFHEIQRVYEDENGERWFKTKGASNSAEDAWITSEDMVLGILDESGFAKFMASLLTTMNNNMMMLVGVILIPLLVLAGMMIMGFVKDVSLAKLELDVVEEKRKLTDEVCVKNDVGFNMDKKTKLKVLAQAKPEEKTDYIALLWEDGQAPNSIRKYYLRQQQMLKFNKQLLELNRECEKMYNDGVKMEKIAKHYSAEKAKIESEREKVEERLKKMRKNYKAAKAETPKATA